MPKDLGPTGTLKARATDEAPLYTGDVLDLPERYTDLGRIAEGGSGEVRRVRDNVLDRVLAMKILHVHHVSRKTRKRFEAEARVMARLQHPGIVAVHDVGVLPDHRTWYTMKEVRGRTFLEVIDELHDTTQDQGWNFRRVLANFQRVCETVAFSHNRGIVHRDLKPANLMVGEFGDILVMDWGLARDMSVWAEEEAEPDSLSDGDHTQDGDVLGTPSYMPPEQASGDSEMVGPSSDVYSLGAVLYQLLAGHPPYRGSTAYEILLKVLSGPPQMPWGPGIGGPEAADLWPLVNHCMEREPEKRPSAAQLVRALQDWLDGARRLEQALEIVDDARALEPRINKVRSEATALRAEATEMLEAIKPTAPEDDKLPAWTLEDRAAELERDATLVETRWLQTLRSALNVAPDLPEAHARLAQHYRGRLQDAEERRDPHKIASFEALLRDHDRGQHAAYLNGAGAVTLVTTPPGAEVLLHRYVPYGRRLVTEEVRSLGTTPLVEEPLEKGSYLLELRMDAHHTVRYPVNIERGSHWAGIRPGDSEPTPIWLPPAGAIGPDELYIPAGWFIAGGDPEAAEVLPRQRVWVDAFAIDRFAVTNRAYLAFLNDLVVAGRPDEALAAAPRDKTSHRDDGARLVYNVCDDGRFSLKTVDVDTRTRLPPGSPLMFVSWHGARAFCEWRSGREGGRWRLPDELEWEKAARGVDGRFFVWGDHPESTWACVLGAHTDDPTRMDVDTFPLDCSAYGVRGMAGNARDFCENLWQADGPDTPGGLLRPVPADDDDDEYRSVRGGAWASVIHHSRVGSRFGARPGIGFANVGFRCARSLD